jgi:predicted  nucleic acid-binding Zn-ribbon protein
MDDESKDILIRIYREAYERSKFEIETQKQKLEEKQKIINRLENQIRIKSHVISALRNNVSRNNSDTDTDTDSD